MVTLYRMWLSNCLLLESMIKNLPSVVSAKALQLDFPTENKEFEHMTREYWW